MNKIGIFLLLVIGLSFSNCTAYTDEAQEAMRDKLLGTWNLVSSTSKNGRTTFTTSNVITFTFFEDGTYVTNSISPFSYEYYISYNDISFDYHQDKSGSIVSFTETKMILSSGYEDDAVLYFYEKTN